MPATPRGLQIGYNGRRPSHETVPYGVNLFHDKDVPCGTSAGYIPCEYTYWGNPRVINRLVRRAIYPISGGVETIASDMVCVDKTETFLV